MPEPIPAPLSLERDGTSQSDRRLPSLAPETAAIDGRRPADWLAFADAYARALAYHGLDGRPAGDWRGFLNPAGLEAKELPALWRETEDFLADPAGFDEASPHRRPHLVLFLAFLRLVGLSQQRLNRLTRQHLDFYYRQLLALEAQAARPDRVDVLARLAAGTAEALLPAGTLLDAGKDGAGGELFYRTDEDLAVNRAQVKSLCSAFVDKKTTGIRQAREESSQSGGGDPLLAMAALVYGDPADGDRLPPYLPGKPLDAALLGKLGSLAGFVDAGLRLEFQEFRNLMRLKSRRQQTAQDDWRAVNETLEAIGRVELNNPRFAIQPKDSPDFWTNLKTALGGNTPDFGSLPGGLKSLEEVYQKRNDPDKAAGIKAFITGKLHLAPAQFAAMMERKMEVDKDWRIVNGLLEAAGQRRRQDPGYRLLPDSPGQPYNHASTAFAQNLQDALGAPDFAPLKDLLDPETGGADLDRLAAALQRLEAYFHCPLEDFALLMAARAKEKQADAKKKPTPAEWDRAYAILAAAHARKVYAGRREKLAGLRQGRGQKDALEAMLRLAAGEPTLAAVELPGRLAGHWPKEGAQSFNTVKAAMEEKTPPALAEDDWQAAAANLELAWRNREGKPPAAQREAWLGLYAAADATAVQAASQGGTPRWRTFGQRREPPSQDRPPAPLLGWGIASPALCLGEGRRDLALTLVFQPGNYNAQEIAALLSQARREDGTTDPALSPFQVEASGAKGWTAPDSLKIASIDHPGPPGAAPSKALRLDLAFEASAPPIAALPGGASRWPMVRLLLRPAWRDDAKRHETPYPLFQALALERVLVQASVAGLKGLRLEGDEGALPDGKPFEPFGPSPAAGSGFQFTHPELAVKRLSRLDLKLEWMKVPAAKLLEHYQNYPDPAFAPNPPGQPAKDNTVFTAKLSLLDRRLEIPLAAKAALFDAADAGQAHTLGVADVAAAVQAARPGHAYLPETETFSLDDPAAWPRGWRLELDGADFQHGNYPKVAAAKSVELAAAIAASLKPGSEAAAPDAADYKLSPPYTPRLKSLSVDYGCSVEIAMDPGDPLAYGRGEERIFHQHAFGPAEIQPERGGGPYRLLPDYPHEGELYIGLEGLAAPRDVAILFQMAEGSADPDLPHRPVEWSYLSGNRWLGLGGGGVLADATAGLAQSGIVKFRLPEALPSTLLPAGLYWLRAAAAQDCDSVCDTIDIKAQAVSATRVDQGGGDLGQPLPAGSIAKTAAPLAGIAGIAQPYTSRGGKPAEQDGPFMLRVSERLRHKQRALALWDYERLVLERFPGVYKAKCIPASSPDPADLGRVDLIVIPDIRGQSPFNPFEPKATAGQIAEINAFLAGHVPPLAEVKAKNAHYVPVRVRFAVRFAPGCDPGFHKARLNDELNRFLSPWAYEEGGDVVIGGKIYANAIVDFLERRPYVDYVAELKLFKNEDGLGFKLAEGADGGPGLRVQPDRPDGVLVADRQHDIDLIADARFEDAAFTGIGYMKIELDFAVA